MVWKLIEIDLEVTSEVFEKNLVHDEILSTIHLQIWPYVGNLEKLQK